MYIYCIENLVNNKCYIGQSVGTKKARLYQHKTDLRGNRHYNNHLQSAWKKYGEENFKIYILEDNISNIDKLNKREKDWIIKLDTYKRQNGYNYKKGGKNSTYSKDFLLEKQKKAQLKRGKIVYQFDLDGNLIKKWNSIRKASRETGINRVNIGQCCNKIKGVKTAGGYQWSFENKMLKYRPRKQYEKIGKKVFQYTLKGELVNIFPTISDASRKTGGDISAISSCCHKTKGYRTCVGFFWSFIPENKKNIKEFLNKSKFNYE